MSRPFKYRFPAGDVRKELPSHFKNNDGRHPLKNSTGTPVSNTRLAELGILVLVEATPTAGKIITESHGEVIADKWTEVIDEELTLEEIKQTRTLFNIRDILNACVAIDTTNSNTVLTDKISTTLSNPLIMGHLSGADTVNLDDPIAQQAMASFTPDEISTIKSEIP